MIKLVLVFCGAGLGALARYKLGGFVLHHTMDWRFPAGTFVVNVVGCLIAGIIAGAVVKQNFFSADAQLFLLTGMMGGFTTFSAFGVETIYLLQRGNAGVAAAYTILSVLVGAAAVGLGMALIPHAQS